MKLDQFISGAVGFATAVATGNAQQINPVEPTIPGAGLPVWPHFALREVTGDLPDPRVVASEAMRALNAVMPFVRAGASVVGATGAAALALAPVAGFIGKAAAPELAAIPYAGPALGVAATTAGPIVAVGGATAAVVGAAAASAPPVDKLAQLGNDVADQLNKVAATQATDAVIDLPIEAPKMQ